MFLCFVPPRFFKKHTPRYTLPPTGVRVFLFCSFSSFLQVCKLRELPIFTFVNKMDRPSLSPFELLDQIEGEFGMQMAPVLWPIGDGERFKVCVWVQQYRTDPRLLACLSYRVGHEARSVKIPRRVGGIS